MVVGAAFEIAMNNLGIPVVKINYQDMSNWAWKTNTKPFLHINVFGRASNAVKQIWPESVYLPDRGTEFYDEFEPLNIGDIEEIKKQIKYIQTFSALSVYYKTSRICLRYLAFVCARPRLFLNQPSNYKMKKIKNRLSFPGAILCHKIGSRILMATFRER